MDAVPNMVLLESVLHILVLVSVRNCSTLRKYHAFRKSAVTNSLRLLGIGSSATVDVQ